MNKDLDMARRIAEKVGDAGGRCYYVGGFVRDRLIGRDNKDVDIEVHGVTPQKLAEILDDLGDRITMGASFGVYGLRHYDLDIAMPRSEKAVGRGHKDFEVTVDPFIGTEKAAQRRDFTINAMMEDILTGEILDHFGGRDDLRNGILRHVNDASFGEDPLRVLRAAQFAARFQFEVAEETVELCSTMDLTALAPERVMEELKKALLKADKPSAFFEVLRRMGQLGVWFPELEYCDWEKVMERFDRAAALKDRAREPLYFMFSSLCVGLDKAVILLARLTNERELTEYVIDMLVHLPTLHKLDGGDAAQLEWNILYDDSLCPHDLLLLDAALCGNTEIDPTALRHLEAYEALMQKPEVMGRDLIAAGLRPDRKFKELLTYAHALHLEGVEKEEALQRVLERRR